MALDFLRPVDRSVLSQADQFHTNCLGQNIQIYTEEHRPDLKEVQIALLGVRENRREVNPINHYFDFNAVRLALYSLFPGNWHTKIADIGDIWAGESIEDTEYAVHE